MPPYHSNFIWASTNSPDTAIKALMNQTQHSWSLKDALGEHDYSQHGFERLFTAKWYWRDPQQQPLPPPTLQVGRVNSATSMNTWVETWGEAPANQPVFHPDLWRTPNISFLYA